MREIDRGLSELSAVSDFPMGAWLYRMSRAYGLDRMLKERTVKYEDPVGERLGA